MSDVPPPASEPLVPSGRRNVVWPVAASVAAHVVLLGALLIPRVAALPPPSEPVNVDLVTASELSSLQSSASSSADQQRSAPASSSQAASSATTSSEAASASQSASSAASSEPPSSTSPSSEAASSTKPSQQQSEAPRPAPRPAPKAHPIIIPLGPVESSSEAAVSASEASSGAPSSGDASASSSPPSAATSEATPITLTAPGAAGAGPGDAVASAAASAPPEPASAAAAEAPSAPVGGGALHVATRFYLADMLKAPGLAQAKGVLKKLPPERRLAQTCNIEATGQAAAAGYPADAIIPNAFAAPSIAGTTYTVFGGAFRADGNWRRIAYECTLTKDLTDVARFSLHIGADVTAEMQARLKGN